MIRELPARCWALQWDGHPAAAGGNHYDTEEQAREDIRNGLAAVHTGKCGGFVITGGEDEDGYCTRCEDPVLSRDFALHPCSPAQLPGPCWVMGCDCGDCDPDEYFDLSGESYECHRPSESAACALAWEAGWRVTTDGRAYAGSCLLPPGSALAPPPRAAQEDAGQLTLVAPAREPAS